MLVDDPGQRITLAEMAEGVGTFHDLRSSVPAKPTSDNQRVAANPSAETASDNLRLSSRGVVEALLSELIECRRARGKRKTLRRPAVATRQERRAGFDRVNLHLRRLSRRLLNDHAKRGEPIPDRAELTAALRAYVLAELDYFIFYQDPGDATGTAPQKHATLAGEPAALRVARSAARYALERWQRGAVGGSHSRRGPTWTADDLAALAKLDGHTRQQQADALGRSRSTVDRMWREIRASQPTPSSATATHAAVRPI
jgi:hypothetical protein